ncbi:MAG TPA: dTMP kinase [Candidatus Saccharimonadales bacterium]|nr:dTMP kinase [Candidatus Saccharimonadales bacterium]
MTEARQTLAGGLVVFFEGIDGVGKTTQLEMAAEDLRGEGWAVETTRAHGGTDIGEALRQVSLSDTPRPVESDMYISLAIHAALVQKIAEYRQQGRIVLIDRGPLSMAAYQMYGDGFDREQGWEYVARELELFAPELNIVYTAAVTVAMERARQRSKAKSDYFESKPEGYFDAARQGYLDAAARFGATVLDAEQSIQQVHAQTMEAIQAALAAKRSR